MVSIRGRIIIPQALASFLFETSLFDPAASALLVGFAVLGWDGQFYLTPSGQQYLEDNHHD